MGLYKLEIVLTRTLRFHSIYDMILLAWHLLSSSNMEAFSNTNTQYHPKDYYTQKWINNPKMGLPLPPTPMEDTNNHNRNLHQQQHGSRYINNHDSTDLMMTTNAKPRGSYHR